MYPMEIESPRISTFGSAGSGVKLQFNLFEVSALEPASGRAVGAATLDKFSAVSSRYVVTAGCIGCVVRFDRSGGVAALDGLWIF